MKQTAGQISTDNLVDNAPKEIALNASSASETNPEDRFSEDIAQLLKTQQRARQIETMALQGTPSQRPRKGWLETAGKYSAEDPINRFFEAGARIRESERDA